MTKGERSYLFQMSQSKAPLDSVKKFLVSGAEEGQAWMIGVDAPGHGGPAGVSLCRWEPRAGSLVHTTLWSPIAQHNAVLVIRYILKHLGMGTFSLAPNRLCWLPMSLRWEATLIPEVDHSGTIQARGIELFVKPIPWIPQDWVLARPLAYVACQAPEQGRQWPPATLCPDPSLVPPAAPERIDLIGTACRADGPCLVCNPEGEPAEQAVPFAGAT